LERGQNINMVIKDLNLNYSYAKQRLAELNNSVSIDGKPVLIRLKNDPKYKVKPINTMLIQSKVIPKEIEIKKIDYLNDLAERFGFGIYTRRVEKQWFKFQSMETKLIRLPTDKRTLTYFPRDMYAEYDTFHKRLRLVGKNSGPMGVSKWVNLTASPIKQEKSLFKMNDFVSNPHDVITNIWKSYVPQAEVQERIENVKEVPIMISEDGSLICIPDNRDADVIGTVGKRGSGKSTLINSFVGRIYWKFGGKHILLNDPFSQTIEWALPLQDKVQRLDLNRINEHPMPLPLVPLYPILGKEKIKMVPQGFKMSMPSEDMFKNYRTFSNGLKTVGLFLGNSEKWFLRLKKEVLECKSIDEIKNVVRENYKSENKMMVEKIITVLDNLAEINFTDLSSGVPSKWNFNGEEIIPLIGLSEVGLIPSIITNQLLSSYKEFYPSYMQFFIDKIIYWQSKHKKTGRLWLHIDEIGDTYKKGNRMSVAGQSINRLLTQGRNHNIGTSFSIQNYSMLDNEVRNNVDYLFSFIYSSNDEINTIAKDWDLSKYEKKSIRRLKNHECLAISNEDSHPFKVYPFDGEPFKATGVFKGITLPPLSQHRLPSK